MTPTLPQAYIIGAPKCGTTALAAYLADHPDVCFSRFKEPHVFADDMPGMKIHPSEADFLNDFPEPRSDRSLRMEGSVFYLLSDVAVDRILARRPDAKFIVMLRDPVSMAPSMHQQALNSLDEDVQDFETAWRLSDARGRGERVPRFCREPRIIRYPVVCALGTQLRRFFARVPPESRLVMLQDDLRADAGAVYRRALAFLGVEDDGRTDFPRINEAVAPRSRLLRYVTQRPWGFLHGPIAPLKRALGIRSFGVMSKLSDLNERRTGGARLSETMREELAAHFAPEVAILSDLLGIDLVRERGWSSSARDKTAA